MNQRLATLGLLATLGCSSEGPIQQIGINEIAAAQGDGDWIEVMNVTDAPVSLSGWTLEMGAMTYDFPETAEVAPQGWLTLDRLMLDDAGGTIALVDLDGAVADEVAFPSVDPGVSFGRLPDANPNWQRLMLTPGSANAR